MSGQVIPDRWVERVRRHIRETRGEDRVRLSGYDFYGNRSVRVEFSDGSHALYRYAFYLKDEALGEVAVFTEHCGYHFFNVEWVQVKGFQDPQPVPSDHGVTTEPQSPVQNWPGLSWRFLARDWNDPGRETHDLSSDGATWFDELVVGDWLHIEWMSGRRWWMRLGDASINVTIPKDRDPIVQIERFVYYQRPSPEEEERSLEDGDVNFGPYGVEED